MHQKIRMSGPTLRLLKQFLERPQQGQSGAEISRQTRIGAGTLYPLLQRLENAAWLKSEWEKVEPTEVGRPRRRFYKLTALGHNTAAKALAEFQTAPGVLAWNS